MRRRAFLGLTVAAPAVAVAQPQGFFSWIKSLFTPRPAVVVPTLPTGTIYTDKVAANIVRLMKNKLAVSRAMKGNSWIDSPIGETVKIRIPYRRVNEEIEG